MDHFREEMESITENHVEKSKSWELKRKRMKGKKVLHEKWLETEDISESVFSCGFATYPTFSLSPGKP